MVEHRAVNARVAGSSPASPARRVHYIDPDELIVPSIGAVILGLSIMLFFLTMLFLCAWRLKTWPF